VSDRTVDAAIASGAGSIEDVAARCGAGGRCGGCWPELQRLLDASEAQGTAADRHAAA
jgi:bacterioferritin-associated ferredoxin